MVWATHTLVNANAPGRSQAGRIWYPPIVTPWEKNRSNGTRAICRGTICRAKTPRNTQSRPGKLTQARA